MSAIEREQAILRGALNEADVIPKSTVLSTKILSIFGMSTIFNHPLWLQNKIPHPNWHIDRSVWLNRGDPLCTFHIRPSGKHRLRSRLGIPVSIPSPVSGLVLCDPRIEGTPFEDNPTMDSLPWATILLPEREPDPEPASDIFGPLCSLCSEHRDYIFFSPPQLSGKYTSEMIDSELNKQLSQGYLLTDLSTDDTNFGARMTEFLSVQRPDINILLESVLARTFTMKHKNLNAPDERQPAMKLSEEEDNDGVSINDAVPLEVTRPSNSFEKKVDTHELQWSEENEKALEHFDIDRPYSRDELNDRYFELTRGAPEEIRKLLSRHYDALLPFAV